MTESKNKDNRSVVEIIGDAIKSLSAKTGKKPFQQIELLTRLKEAGTEGVLNEDISPDTHRAGSIIANLNKRILGPLGLKAKGQIHYTIVKIKDDQDSSNK